MELFDVGTVSTSLNNQFMRIGEDEKVHSKVNAEPSLTIVSVGNFSSWNPTDRMKSIQDQIFSLMWSDPMIRQLHISVLMDVRISLE